MAKVLTITPAPFKPSNLSIPPSPCSPRLPLTPPASLPRAVSLAPNRNRRELTSPSTLPPPSPLKWVWQCHMCHQSYPIATTRRCLDDGHYFCSGVTTVKTWRASANPRKTRKTKRHRACASEFDYGGWEAFGQWRRDEEVLRNASFPTMNIMSSRVPARTTRSRDCWNACDFPSQCSWGSQCGLDISTPIPPSLAEQDNDQRAMKDSPAQDWPSTVPGVIKLGISTAASTSPPTTFDGILDRHQEGELSPLSPKELRGRFWDGILDSARQRRSRKSAKDHSPLALNPVTEEDEPASPNDLAREQLVCPEPVAFDPTTLSKTALEVSDRWKMLELGQEHLHLQVPESVLVANQGFDFGFETAEDGMDAGIQMRGSDEECEGKSKKLKRKLGKRM